MKEGYQEEWYQEAQYWLEKNKHKLELHKQRTNAMTDQTKKEWDTFFAEQGYAVDARVEEEREDMVNSPAHYTKGSIETIDYIVDVLGTCGAAEYCHGNVLKYLGARLYSKGDPVENAEKAQWYLAKMIELFKEPA